MLHSELSSFLGLLVAILPLALGAPAVESLESEILTAMKRDLGLHAEQATARVAREISAIEVIDQLRSSAGDLFAGAWVSNDGHTISVGVTNEALSAKVVAAGATPVIFANSLSKLEEAKVALDKLAAQPQTFDTSADANVVSPIVGVASWYIDVISNKVVLEALADSTIQAKELAVQVGLAESEFEVRTVSELPITFATVQSGDGYLVSGSNARCSVGFTVTTGFVTAGHCGRPGATVTTLSGELLGSFFGSVFPGSADMGYVRTVAGTILKGGIAGGGLPITGSTPAPVGSSICRSSSTTGVFCGTVRAIGVTVNYAEGSVTGLTLTTVCSVPGDSGRPFYTGSQAQGVTSGGSGNCSSGGTTYFQPVNEILATYGLTLIKG